MNNDYKGYEGLPDDDDEFEGFFKFDIDPQPIPDWLTNAVNQDEILRQFIESRLVFYPNSSTSGVDVECFAGPNSAAHCFLHVDVEIAGEAVLGELNNGGMTGYETDDVYPVSCSELTNVLGDDHAVEDLEIGKLIILQRQARFNDDHGPARLALLHLQMDAREVFNLIWRHHGRGPFAVVLESDRPAIPALQFPLFEFPEPSWPNFLFWFVPQVDGNDDWNVVEGFELLKHGRRRLKSFGIFQKLNHG